MTPTPTGQTGTHPNDRRFRTDAEVLGRVAAMRSSRRLPKDPASDRIWLDRHKRAVAAERTLAAKDNARTRVLGQARTALEKKALKLSQEAQSMNRTQATTILRNLGWRVNTTAQYTQAVRDFQAGWNLGSALKVDGVVGPVTAKALATSEKRRKGKQPTASANFSFIEFRCKCGGRYASCRRISIARKQVQALEVYRRRLGRSLTPVSGYRCPGHNKSVGGASKSQHMSANATDVPGELTLSQVRALKVFTGIGYKASTGRVLHVDTRPGNAGSPTVWRYA